MHIYIHMFRTISEFAQSRDCVAHSQNPEIAHYYNSCAISRLRNTPAQSFTPTCMCRNHLVVAKEATKKWRLCVCHVK